ncbi:marine proteobacterial sortase target protein [Pseudomarimonas arenosa]|uniref:Marine proteobacterial sortase target protein n=1 Tax=Pseudomarimonas arenosa TaxID=2774145 RepID=A0AAW3ZIR9_9GAMM|nr:marine proteobacterial sortase target protein [Pseudomarimonas arenosa]MBD8525129.1 marine proteobacterial sortase target protein [Pseudomarimonas arenosa]
MSKPSSNSPNPPSFGRGARLTQRPRMLACRRLRQRWAALLTVLLSLSASASMAAEFGWAVRNGSDQWLPQLAMDTTVRIQVTGLIAKVSLTQHYQNGSQAWQQGRYLLPLPSDAAVSDLRIRVGDRLIEGEIQEKQQAAATYQQAASLGQRAALIEQARSNLFQTQVANIAPGEALQIEIDFWQPVSYRDREFSLALPFTLTPRYGDKQWPDPDSPADIGEPKTTDIVLQPTVSLHASVDPGVEIARVHSDTHAISVDLQDGRFEVALANLVEASDRDFELRWTPAPYATPQRALFTEQIDDTTYVMLLVLPPTLPTSSVPRELLLVLDQSGSMQGSSMQQAQAALDFALSALRPDDKFNLLAFNDRTEALFQQSVDAAPAHVALARHWLAGLSANGGTEMAPALHKALTMPTTHGYLRQVVLVTDAAIGNEQALLKMLESERGEARLFTVGIGSAPNEYFVRKAAELGQGSFEMVRDLSAVQPRMQALLTRINSPLMQDLRIEWPAAVDAFPSQIPDLYAGEPLQLLAALPNHDSGMWAGEHIRVSGIGNATKWNDQLTLEAKRYVQPMGVARLWARAKLEALQDQMRHGADPAAIRQQSLALALAHRIVGRYTSLVAVERQPTRPQAESLASTRIQNAAPADGLSMAQGSTPARSLFSLALVLGLVGAALWRSARPEPTSPRRQPGRAD